MTDPGRLIAALDLERHPEGGWYRETWRAAEGPEGRGSASAILFLLEARRRSHWHRVDAAELWLWHAGHRLDLSVAADDAGPAASVALGPDVLAGEAPQHVVPAHHWQAAEARQGWALVSCVVSPGFTFEGFTLAPDDWRPGG